MWISDELEFWPDSLGRFTHIATLHSELIALSSSGQIYQWRWNDPEPYKHADVCTFVAHQQSNFSIDILTESECSSSKNDSFGLGGRKGDAFVGLFYTL